MVCSSVGWAPVDAVSLYKALLLLSLQPAKAFKAFETWQVQEAI
jgi:hypothetical protein